MKKRTSRIISLTAEDQQKLDTFERVIITHPQSQRAFDELMNTILTPAGANIVMVIGPTGVGKTALLRRTVNELRQFELANENRNLGHIPYGSLVLPSYEGGRFNWKNFHKRILEIFDEPLISYKTRYKPVELRTAQNSLVIRSNPSTAELSDAVEKTLKHRGVKALLIDEGAHFAKVAGGDALLNQMDTLKSLADRTGTLLVLFGPYEMNALTKLSSQLDRRTKVIHFPRYEAAVEKDIGAFKLALGEFQKVLPLLADFYLADYWQELFAGSLGCIGMLKDWLTAAISDGLKSSGQTLFWKHVKKHMAPPGRLANRLQQIQTGEKEYASNEQELALLYLRLGLKTNDDNLAPNTKKSGASRHPGQRLPGRDPVGS